MSRPIRVGILGILVLMQAFFALDAAKAQPIQMAAKGQGGALDVASLEKVDANALIKNGCAAGKTDFQSVIKEADERIAAIKARNGYTELDLDMLTSPWVRTKEFATLLQQGQPLPEIKLAVRTQRNGVFDTGGTAVFKGEAKRGVEILREIGLRDQANERSWSDMWGIMERIATPLGRKPNGDIAVRVDVVLGIGKDSEFVYKQIYNVRDIERYSEHDLGDGNYVIYQDLLQDDSTGAPPRATTKKNWCPKKYCPINEQISITIVHDNKNGTFTLANFMSTHGQKLEAVTGWARFFSFFVDLQKEMERDTIANRQIWNKLFQREVLATD
jgi:hypothetical protein